MKGIRRCIILIRGTDWINTAILSKNNGKVSALVLPFQQYWLQPAQIRGMECQTWGAWRHGSDLNL